jgi:hypothetical protein
MYLPIVFDSGYKVIYAEKTDPVARYKYNLHLPTEL